jgi:hypothetical protein
MSKRIARRKKSEGAKQKRSRRKFIVAGSLLLLLTLSIVITARWPHLMGLSRPPLAPPVSLNANSPSKEYIYAGGGLIATEEPAGGSGTAPLAPTAFLATAQPTQSTSTVHLTWTAPASSFDHYQVEMKQHLSDAQWTPVNTNLANTATTYDDTGALPNKAYLYRICAVAGNQLTCTAPDLTTTTYFQDYPFQINQTHIRAQHFLDLMSAVNAVRSLADMQPVTWSGGVAPAVGGTIQASHLNDLRNGLKLALTTLGFPAPQYEAPDPVVSNSTQVKASQLRELQDLVR